MRRDRVGVKGDEVVTEFCDDGHSRPRLDRPGLDALRDAGMIGPPPKCPTMHLDRGHDSGKTRDLLEILGDRAEIAVKV